MGAYVISLELTSQFSHNSLHTSASKNASSVNSRVVTNASLVRDLFCWLAHGDGRFQSRLIRATKPSLSETGAEYDTAGCCCSSCYCNGCGAGGVCGRRWLMKCPHCGLIKCRSTHGPPSTQRRRFVAFTAASTH